MSTVPLGLGSGLDSYHYLHFINKEPSIREVIGFAQGHLASKWHPLDHRPLLAHGSSVMPCREGATQVGETGRVWELGNLVCS